MSAMPGMHELPALSWSSFFGTWTLAPGWLLAALLMAGGYLAARHRAGAGTTVRGWRVASFTAGCILLWACIASAVGVYAMSLFWMHMVLHLLLIMVVPALLVLGHPVTVLIEALPGQRQHRAREVARSWPVTLLTHQSTGLLLYAVVIVGTHLTGFMDQMVLHPWLMTAEQVLYVLTGFLFLLPLLGDEPIRPDPPYLMRLVLLLVAMVPDTVVGIVLLQTDHDLFPVMMGNHPGWAPEAVADINIGGGLMWAGGDGLMMALAVGLMLSVITSPARRTRMTGAWLESVRSATLAPEAGSSDPDPDSEAALEAYNRRLRRLGAAGEDGGPTAAGPTGPHASPSIEGDTRT
jgi:cytochrome c oxidase assembly factor CtaG